MKLLGTNLGHHESYTPENCHGLLENHQQIFNEKYILYMNSQMVNFSFYCHGKFFLEGVNRLMFDKFHDDVQSDLAARKKLPSKNGSSEVF